ncbi:MAG: hypothetical protein ACK4PR_02905, partial [Gammaproteobacteria bacterium]
MVETKQSFTSGRPCNFTGLMQSVADGTLQTGIQAGIAARFLPPHVRLGAMGTAMGVGGTAAAGSHAFGCVATPTSQTSQSTSVSESADNSTPQIKVSYEEMKLTIRNTYILSGVSRSDIDKALDYALTEVKSDIKLIYQEAKEVKKWLEEQDATKRQQFELEQINQFFSFGYGLATLTRCPEMQQVLTFTQSVMAGYQAVKQIVNVAQDFIANGLKNITAGGVLGPIGMLGGALTSIIGLFMDSGPDPTQLILDRLQDISKQIYALQQQMGESFEQCFKNQALILNTIQKGFNHLHYYIGTQLAEIKSELRHSLLHIQQDLNLLVRLTESAAKEPYFFRLNECVADADNWLSGTSDGGQAGSRIPKLCNKLSNLAVKHSQAKTLIGLNLWEALKNKQNDHTDSPKFITTVNKYLNSTDKTLSLNSFIGFLGAYAQSALKQTDKAEATQQPLLMCNFESLPNPLFWQAAVNKYVALKLNFATFDNDPGNSQLDTLNKKGKEIQIFVQALKTEPEFWNGLLEKYYEAIKQVHQTFEQYVQYFSDQKLKEFNEQYYEKEEDYIKNWNILEEPQQLIDEFQKRTLSRKKVTHFKGKDGIADLELTDGLYNHFSNREMLPAEFLCTSFLNLNALKIGLQEIADVDVKMNGIPGAATGANGGHYCAHNNVLTIPVNAHHWYLDWRHFMNNDSWHLTFIISDFENTVNYLTFKYKDEWHGRTNHTVTISVSAPRVSGGIINNPQVQLPVLYQIIANSDNSTLTCCEHNITDNNAKNMIRAAMKKFMTDCWSSAERGSFSNVGNVAPKDVDNQKQKIIAFYVDMRQKLASNLRQAILFDDQVELAGLGPFQAAVENLKMRVFFIERYLLLAGINLHSQEMQVISHNIFTLAKASKELKDFIGYEFFFPAELPEDKEIVRGVVYLIVQENKVLYKCVTPKDELVKDELTKNDLSNISMLNRNNISYDQKIKILQITSKRGHTSSPPTQEESLNLKIMPTLDALKDFSKQQEQTSSTTVDTPEKTYKKLTFDDIHPILGCDFIVMDSVPEKEKLSDLPNKSLAAYVLVKEKLYFIHKGAQEFVDLKVTSAQRQQLEAYLKFIEIKVTEPKTLEFKVLNKFASILDHQPICLDQLNPQHPLRLIALGLQQLKIYQVWKELQQEKFPELSQFDNIHSFIAKCIAVKEEIFMDETYEALQDLKAESFNHAKFKVQRMVQYFQSFSVGEYMKVYLQITRWGLQKSLSNHATGGIYAEKLHAAFDDITLQQKILHIGRRDWQSNLAFLLKMTQETAKEQNKPFLGAHLKTEQAANLTMWGDSLLSFFQLIFNPENAPIAKAAKNTIKEQLNTLNDFITVGKRIQYAIYAICLSEEIPLLFIDQYKSILIEVRDKIRSNFSKPQVLDIIKNREAAGLLVRKLKCYAIVINFYLSLMLGHEFDLDPVFKKSCYFLNDDELITHLSHLHDGIKQQSFIGEIEHLLNRAGDVKKYLKSKGDYLRELSAFWYFLQTYSSHHPGATSDLILFTNDLGKLGFIEEKLEMIEDFLKLNPAITTIKLYNYVLEDTQSENIVYPHPMTYFLIKMINKLSSIHTLEISGGALGKETRNAIKQYCGHLTLLVDQVITITHTPVNYMIKDMWKKFSSMDFSLSKLNYPGQTKNTPVYRLPLKLPAGCPHFSLLLNTAESAQKGLTQILLSQEMEATLCRVQYKLQNRVAALTRNAENKAKFLY